MNVEEVGAAPWLGAWPLGCPPSPYKRSPPPSLSLTPPREGSLSPSRIYPPWSRTSEIHVPGGFSARKSCASAASLERGGGGCSVPRTWVRAQMRRCVAALGLPLDLEIGKRSSTSTTSLNSLSFVNLQGYVLSGYTSARCLYLVDRSWYIVPIVGIFLFSMMRTVQCYQSRIYAQMLYTGSTHMSMWTMMIMLLLLSCNFGYWWHSGMKQPGQTLHVLAHETCSTLDMQLVCISG